MLRLYLELRKAFTVWINNKKTVIKKSTKPKEKVVENF